MLAIVANNEANNIINGNRLVSKKADAAGVINIATIIDMPTACNETTIVTAIKTKRSLSKNPAGNRNVVAKVESKDITKNSLKNKYTIKRIITLNTKINRKSLFVTPKISPNKKCDKSTV